MSIQYTADTNDLNVAPSSGCITGDDTTTGYVSINLSKTDAGTNDVSAQLAAVEVGDTISIYDDTAAAMLMEFVIDTITPQSTWYYFTAAAGEPVGQTSGHNYTVTFTPAGGVPWAPTNVSASDGMYITKVAVSWTASDGATSYKVYRNTSDSSSGSTLLDGSVAGTSYDDTAAPIGVPLWYFIKATNEYGDSNYSTSAIGFRKLDTTKMPDPTTEVLTGADCINNTFDGYTTGSAEGGGGNDPTLSVLLAAIDAATIVTGTTITATEGTNHVDGSYPTTATSKGEQLAEDQSAVDAVKSSIKTTVVNLLGSVTGTLDMSLYVLKADVVGKAWVVSGHDTFAGGDPGEYPTTATSKAAQLADDRLELTGVADHLERPADGGPSNVLGTVNGTLNTSTIASSAFAEGEAAQLATDRSAVDGVAEFILRPADGGPATVLGTVTGTMQQPTLTEEEHGWLSAVKAVTDKLDSMIEVVP